MKVALTKRQQEALNFIKLYIAEKHVSPTFREIASALGHTSIGHVNRVVTSLEKRGHIYRIPGVRRSITLVPDNVAEVEALRVVRDAANAFVSIQEQFRRLYEEGSDEAQDMGRRVSSAFDRLRDVVRGEA